jgi:hypothetical protein
MKTQITILFLALTTLLSAQQNICTSSYMSFTEGTEFEYSGYDKKGKLTTISSQHIETIDEVDGGFQANVHFKLTSDKGEEVSKGVYEMLCKGDVIYMDLSNLLNPSALAAFKDMEVEVENEQMDLPNKLTIGQMLQEGAITMKAKMEGMTLLNMRVRIYDRKVEKMERIKTPAGTFDCVKITEQTEIKMGLKRTMASATWYAVGVGMVKTEVYDKKGEVESSTVLTKFKK